MIMLQKYYEERDKRKKEGLPPIPLKAQEVQEIANAFENGSEDSELLGLIENQVSPGVDEAAYVKAAFLKDLALEKTKTNLITPQKSIQLLGTMLGGYSVEALVEVLKKGKFAAEAAEALKNTILVYDSFNEIFELSKNNSHAKSILESWANAEWFENKPTLDKEIELTIYKVSGETNTDDFSPAKEAWSRPDIPLHALAMLKMPRENIVPDKEGDVGPMNEIEELKKKGHPLAYVGDVVGTGSSRKSATNSVLWHMGDDAPYIPNKRFGGVCLGGKIAPIFYNTMEDSGALPIELDVSSMNTGDVVDIYPHKGVAKNGDTTIEFKLKTDVLIDEVRAGGRIPLIVGRNLTARARESLGLPESDVFRKPDTPDVKVKGYTLAQKMVGKACGVEGVVPGQYCEPRMTTVGSQDTTGPMTRDELKDLACLGFSADLVMQSFCHTAAYPKPVDVVTHHTLPDFIRTFFFIFFIFLTNDNFRTTTTTTTTRSNQQVRVVVSP